MTIIPHPFPALAAEYRGELARMVQTRQPEAHAAAVRIMPLMPHYQNVAWKTGVKPVVLAALMERESGSKLNTYLGNGQSLHQVTTIVPKNRGPFPTWDAGAIDALHLDGLDKVAGLDGGWSPERALYEEEEWNGFGPRGHGRHTGYLWAGTNIYAETGYGKYVDDGKWNPTFRDPQLGCVPIMIELIKLDPSLDLTPSLLAMVGTGAGQPIIVPPAPVPLVFALGSIGWVQKRLNDVQDAGLIMDGSFGRKTKAAVREYQAAHPPLEVDGIPGPATVAVLNA